MALIMENPEDVVAEFCKTAGSSTTDIVPKCVGFDTYAIGRCSGYRNEHG